MRHPKSVKAKIALAAAISGIALTAGYSVLECGPQVTSPDQAHPEASGFEQAPATAAMYPTFDPSQLPQELAPQTEISTAAENVNSQTTTPTATASGPDTSNPTDAPTATASVTKKPKKKKLDELENLLDKDDENFGTAEASETALENGKSGESMLLGEIDNYGDSDLAAELKELQISYKQYLKIMRRQARLKEDLKRADANGSSHLRRLLINDHIAWVREQLGSVTYERYAEWTGRSIE